MGHSSVYGRAFRMSGGVTPAAIAVCRDCGSVNSNLVQRTVLRHELRYLAEEKTRCPVIGRDKVA
jgi:hypothetical protein